MASFKVNGIDELTSFFDSIAEIPVSVQEEMVNKQSDILVKAQAEKARSMLQGEYYEGAVAEAITKKNAQRSGDGMEQKITFEGTQHGTRVTEIAFLNEYGTEAQPGRPFIQTANEQSADATQKAAQEVLDNWIGK